MLRLSYPRRQQYRRLRRSAASGAAGLAAGALAAIAADVGAIAIAGVLVLVMVGLLFHAHHCVRLAGRSRVGARSEDEVRRALAPLKAERWRLRHSLPYRRRGDIDSVAIAPTGIAFAIETKTRTFDARHLAGVRETATWMYRRRRRWCRPGALPVLCVVRAQDVDRVQDGVLDVSVDRLVPSLRAAAGTAQRPAFLGADTWRGVDRDRGPADAVRHGAMDDRCSAIPWPALGGPGYARRRAGDRPVGADVTGAVEQ
jgi:hypothetical protein